MGERIREIQEHYTEQEADDHIKIRVQASRAALLRPAVYILGGILLSSSPTMARTREAHSTRRASSDTVRFV